VIFLVSIAGCLIGTLVTPPEEEATLKQFYKTVNPWGFWGPISRKGPQRRSQFCTQSKL
jgi:SSS family solute:Na+ symporter